MTNYFPRTVFVDQNGLFAQLNHIQSELGELFEAYFTEPTGRVAEEAMDLVHSVETLLHILEERYAVKLDYVRDYVESKNAARGYYAAGIDTPPAPLVGAGRPASNCFSGDYRNV